MGDQKSLFDSRSYRGARPPSYAIEAPAAGLTVAATLPAYHAYLGSAGYSQYTPDDFTADIRRFSQFMPDRRLEEIQTADLQQWVNQLKQTMPPKTVSRKVSALRNYFRWLQAERVLSQSPAERLRAQHVTPPLPQLLYETECERLLTTASGDARTYLLVLLLLETGLKKAELLALQRSDFDFSNRYQPELWLRHSGKQVFKDRRLKLPPAVIEVFDEYIREYAVDDILFPYAPRRLEQLLRGIAHQAGITKPVTASALRDAFVVRSVKRGAKLDDVFAKLGLSKTGQEEARKKYSRLTSEAL